LQTIIENHIEPIIRKPFTSFWIRKKTFVPFRKEMMSAANELTFVVSHSNKISSIFEPDEDGKVHTLKVMILGDVIRRIYV
jgi:hypothetical protein